MTTVVESQIMLERPHQCPLCRRLFYFDNDYVNHKCVAKGEKLRWV